ncbi:TlpA disulfide reductase family protein [Povalibacter sp.]|uniref:TlpA family protein disulfide reductase n=1 Tax=Povalibacter sp. TaxID=1962978 RepID=UPI002F427319
MRKLAARPLLTGLLLAWMMLFISTAHAADAFDLSHYRGKVVLVDFWASWCEPCRHSFPWLNEMQARYADRGLVVIGINVDRTQADAARFLRDVPARFPIVFDPAGTLASQYDVPGMPSTFVFGPDGEIVSRHIGFRDGQRAGREAELQKLLAGPGVALATE